MIMMVVVTVVMVIIDGGGGGNGGGRGNDGDREMVVFSRTFYKTSNSIQALGGLVSQQTQIRGSCNL